MVNTTPVASPVPAATPAPFLHARAARQRLRAVGPDEVADLGDLTGVPGLLPPGATWLPAPQHTVPQLPGHPPMIGYLVLVPADQYGGAAALPVREGGAASVREEGAAAQDELVRIDSVRRIATVEGEELQLTYLEFELLAHLVAHPHRVHTRDQLVTTVWGYGHVGDGRTVDVHVARLRRKLGARHRGAIQTVRRVGYKYTP
ncbi:winged helix-turn-helix transcriptional regulator [Streptomyces sp. TRM66268-LWL]|uniref:Winged helix-turn-helix transcriptional regulator n=1 Tax=Streptomyces polyasparticus TaxID=2767826 RepID=A0ABR7SCP7_9ACTN|nr:winged helix-turn-helix domain-containing protein [Streptomyces polyasparticus]MBC9712377.1 winged helix-turn-helix transcriptional regulator [Streptomyces polyasparticus]